MKGAFLDTVGLIAVWDSNDQWHAAAAAKFAELLQANMPLFTTNLILRECGNAATRRPYRPRVNALRAELQNAGLLIEPSGSETDDAWAAFDRGANALHGQQTSGKNPGLTARSGVLKEIPRGLL